MGVYDSRAWKRDIALCVGVVPVIFAQTCVPESTLARHGWLSELGTRPLGETLRLHPGVEYGELEFKELSFDDPVVVSIAGLGDHATETLWARRRWVALDRCRLLVQEMFVRSPAMGPST
jgi:chorismate-pyruvate lyase